jgi:hypothetical protein
MKTAMRVAEEVVRLRRRPGGELLFLVGCVVVERGTDSVGKTWLCAQLMRQRIADAIEQDRASRASGKAVKAPMAIAEEIVVVESVPGGLRMFVRPVMFDLYRPDAIGLFARIARMAITAAIQRDRTRKREQAP